MSETTHTNDSSRPVDNRPALIALALGVCSLPATLTVLGGIVLGIAAIIIGFVGIAWSHRMDGAGESIAAGGIAAGMFGMALSAAIPLFLG
jgi:hypothetical protein